MKRIRKIFRALQLYRINEYIYKYDLEVPIPTVTPRLEVEVTMTEGKILSGGKSYIFTAYHDNKRASELHLVFDSLLAKQIGLKGYAIIGNGVTQEAFRGQNIYGVLLTAILRHYKNMNLQRDIYMFIAPDNFSVIRVMDKVGCKRQYRIEVTRFLGFCIRKKTFSD